MLANSHLRESKGTVRQVADTCSVVHAVAGDVAPVRHDGAFVAWELAREPREQGRLAGAVRPEEGNPFARGEFQRQWGKGEGGVPDGELDDPQS